MRVTHHLTDAKRFAWVRPTADSLSTGASYARDEQSFNITFRMDKRSYSLRFDHAEASMLHSRLSEFLKTFDKHMEPYRVKEGA